MASKYQFEMMTREDAERIVEYRRREIAERGSLTAEMHSDGVKAWRMVLYETTTQAERDAVREWRLSRDQAVEIARLDASDQTADAPWLDE
jgi:hypothetical protein